MRRRYQARLSGPIADRIDVLRHVRPASPASHDPFQAAETSATVRERVDCVLRSGPSPDSSLVARRVAVLPQLTCASPAYLARHGVPADPAHLDGHQAVNFASGTGRLHPFEFMQDGRLITLALPGRVTVSNAEAYVLCCEAGAGLIQLPRYHVEEALEAGRLVEVLPDHAPPARTVAECASLSIRLISPM